MFYNRLDEVVGTLASLLQDAIDQREMCAFLCRSHTSALKEHLKALGMDTDRHPSIVLIPFSKALTEGYSEVTIGQHMRVFVQQAKGLGYSGARLIMNVPEELAAQVPSDDSWRELDLVREELGLTVICLYDLVSLSPEFLLKSLASFPKVIMDGAISRNFYYLPTTEGGTMDRQRDLYQLLDNIKAEREERLSEEEERSRLMQMNRQLQEEMLRRRMVEFSLLQAENNLRTMLDAMDDAVFMVDRDLRVTMGNHAFIRYLKENDQDTYFEGKSVFELFPGSPPGTGQLYEEVFQYGYATVVDESIHLTNGLFEAEVRRVPVKMGNVVDRIVVIFRNKPAKLSVMQEMWGFADQLREEVLDPEGPMRGMRDKCPHPVLVTNMDGRIFDFNDAVCRKFGYTREELNDLGSSLALLLPADQRMGMHVRSNYDGHITMPSMLRRKDGSHLRADCYICCAGEGEDHRIITIIMTVV